MQIEDDNKNDGDGSGEEDSAPNLDDVIAGALIGEGDDGEKQENQNPDPKTGESEQTDEEQDDDESSENDDEEDTVVVPSEWTDEQTELFEGLEPDVQELVLGSGKKFQADYTRKTQDLAEQSQTITGLNEVIERHRDMIELGGTSPAQAVATLFAAQRVLERDSVKGIQYLMKSYGVSSEDLVGKTGQDNDGEPELILPGMKEIQDRLDAIEKSRTDSQAAEHNRGQQEAADVIATFESAKDTDTGSLLHPHMTSDNVRKMVGNFLGNQDAKDLEEAYDMAVRTLNLGNVKPKSNPKGDAASRRGKVTRAKRAGRNPSQRSDGKSGKITDIDGAIDAAFKSTGVTGAV